MTEKKRPKGHYVSVGIAIGIGIFGVLGFIVSALTDNFALLGVGPAVGVPIGILIGQSLESKKEREGMIRELTIQEKQRQQIMIFIGIGLAFLGILGFLLFAIVNS